MNTKAQILARFKELEGKTTDLFTQLDSYSEEDKKFSPSEDKWSINQILLHLYFSERGTWKVINRSLEKDPSKTVSWTDKIKYRALKIALQSKKKIKAPDSINNIPNDVSYQEIKEKWHFNRTNWKELLENYPEEKLDKFVFKHPLSGDMNIDMTLGFIELHFERHRKQILELRVES